MRSLGTHLPLCSALLLLLVFAVDACASGEVANSLTIDARTASQVPGASSYRGGTLTSKSGHSIDINSMYVTRDGRPWLPVMGEFHFSRVPESEWEEEILKMKSAGVQIISTYVIWIHHEEIEGEFDWSGRRDLKRFVKLCARHDMYVFARIGPWAHGEARNGGFPDWLLKGPTRLNDPAYMVSVNAFYAQIAQQLKGLLWKDGGPVIGIQLENEYAGRGPKQGEEYILALKRLAIENGLDVPMYTVTGWDNAVVPKSEVLPVFGGYPDAPWDASRTELPPNEVYAYRFQSRVAGNMGVIGSKSSSDGADTGRSDTPFLAAELGGGVEDTYHRRPVIEPDDIAAMVPVMLGSGANLYGYYMFQGGENPDGKLTTLQESQATGYPADVPIKSYDFQAPLSEFGLERASFRKLKVFHYFLNDFGEELASMAVHAPAKTPRDPSDFNVLRASVRSQGERGFLFVNNYVRGAKTPERNNVQFQVLLPDSTLRIPEQPIDIPSGAYFVWPFNLRLADSTLIYSTAQLFTRMKIGDGEAYVFEEIPGIPAQFVLRNDFDLTLRANGALIQKRDATISISRMPTGFSHVINIRKSTGSEIRLILLSQKEAENTWKTEIGGSLHLLKTDQDFFADGKAFVLQSRGEPQCEFSLFPEVAGGLRLVGGKLSLQGDGESKRYAGSVPEAHTELKIQKIKSGGEVSSVKLGPSLSWRPVGVAMAPQDSDFGIAAKWRISVSRLSTDAIVSNVFLKIAYTGDVARLSVAGDLLDDNFFNGLPWMVGLRRFNQKVESGELELSILPLRNDSPIFIEPGYWPTFGDTNQLVNLKSATLIPQYTFRVEMISE